MKPNRNVLNTSAQKNVRLKRSAGLSPFLLRWGKHLPSVAHPEGTPLGSLVHHCHQSLYVTTRLCHPQARTRVTSRSLNGKNIHRHLSRQNPSDICVMDIISIWPLRKQPQGQNCLAEATQPGFVTTGISSGADPLSLLILHKPGLFYGVPNFGFHGRLPDVTWISGCRMNRLQDTEISETPRPITPFDSAPKSVPKSVLRATASFPLFLNSLRRASPSPEHAAHASS